MKKRVEVSVQKAIHWPNGQFAGVLRVGLFKDKIDQAVARPPVNMATHDVFLCDSDGLLVALSGSNDYVTIDDEVRVSPAKAPPVVREALKQPLLKTVNAGKPVVHDEFKLSGTTFLYTYHILPGTQDWVVGIVVPRRAYLTTLLPVSARHIVQGLVVLGLITAVLGGFVLRSVSVAHNIILRESALMNEFVLDPSSNNSRFVDINRVLSSLERAKTAMRSMGKYVPLDLVRRLYHQGEEPRLGGEATELSVLFTDIQGFTAFSETVDGDTVAEKLGAYMHVMATGIQQEKGTIDKFIGDSVMAFWNAPEPVPGHPALACRAALAQPGGVAGSVRLAGVGGAAGIRDALRDQPLRGLGGALRVAGAVQLHGHRGWDQSRLAAGTAQQTLRHGDHRERRDAGGGGPGISLPPSRPCGGEGQDRVPRYL